METRSLTERERFGWLQLSRSPRIGPITFFQLLARYGSATAALEALPCLAGGRAKAAPAGRIESELEAAAAGGYRFIAACEPAYPQPLLAIADPPPVVCVKGDADLFERDAIAIVGARNASAAGQRLAADLARSLGQRGIMVVSGLARGIDAAAHQAAVTSGTIAVVAGGADILYPPEHNDLFEAIGESGLIVSERPLGFQPTGRDFPRRNRIISGLSRGVIVVEAAIRSGTLITARYALEQGREVFAVPGSPLDPRCQGTNRLIRDGALLVESGEDVIDALASMSRQLRDYEQGRFRFDATASARPSRPVAVSSLRGRVEELLSHSPVHRDLLIRQSGGGASEVGNILLELVLAGKAAELPGARFTLPAGDDA